MMESGRNSRVTGSDSRIESNIQCSISDLPKDILVKILLRLTVKRIFVCKCVCKSWYDLISDPEFAKLHFELSEVCPLLESLNSMYLVEPEKLDFDMKLGMCDRKVSFKLDLMFQFPPFSCFTVNSCNGLLLLYFPSPLPNELLTVCNPITGERIYLPDGRKLNPQYNHIKYGFGFSSTSKEYKVIRMIHCGSSSSQDMMVQVHVLGTESWKDKGLLTLSIHESYPTYVNGFLYWSDDLISKPIVSFDVEKECFRSFSVKGVDRLELCESVSLGELGLELCVSGFLRSGAFHVWVMKDHCDEKVWSHVFSIDMFSYGRQLNGPLRLVKYLKDGSLLMFQCYERALICTDSRKSAVRYFKVHGTKSPFVRAMAYIPSFVSLKHVLSNQKANMKVLIDTQRFTELEREARDVFAVEEDICALFSDSDSDIDHFPLEAGDSDSEGAGLELHQEEIESEDEDQETGSEDGNHDIDSEDEDQEVDSEDEDWEIGSEDGHHEFSANNRDEDQECDPEEVDSKDRNDNQEFDFEDREGILELDSEGGDGEFDQEDSAPFDPEDGDGEFDSENEFNPEDEDHKFGLENVDPELDSEDGFGDAQFNFKDGAMGTETFDYDDGDQDYDSDNDH